MVPVTPRPYSSHERQRTVDAGRSARVGTLIYLLIMTSVIVVMVLKPV